MSSTEHEGACDRAADPPLIDADSEFCIRTSIRCEECGGRGAGLPVEAGAEPGDCPRCDGLGRRQQWTPLPEFLDLLLATAISRHPDEPAPEEPETHREEERLFSELAAPLRQSIERLETRLEDKAQTLRTEIRELDGRLNDAFSRMYRLEKP